MDTPLHQSIYIMTLNTLWGGRGTGSELEGAWRGATPAFYPPARLSNCTIKACQKYSNKSNGTARQHACTTPARTLPSAQGVRYRMLYVVLSGQATRGRDGAFRDIAIPAPGSGRQRQNLQLNFGKQACTQCVYSPRARRRGEVHSPSVRRRACRPGHAAM